MSLVVLGAAAAGASVGAAPVGAAGSSRWSFPDLARDPLAPPTGVYAAQSLPRIEVTLIGADAPDHPLAVVRVNTHPPVRRVVRPGDRVGDYRILAIDARSVRVAVPGFGAHATLDLAVGDTTLAPR